ncbi:MAG: MarR family transcriptional regulator [Bacillota bacterium]|nr:MarR family transcriptional regulator [Candidatus Fermentithermobacillaceae bacterium]HOA70540.1 MarR family transcriptional regulator [Bacillota bacterium]HOP71107.1 MarR family transcriptional regulator [Bacillota bacterium]HPT35301.1 MarR family transcriptional regulator [Bacillota bacterium]HPZ85898.1 MarR family transcriptional regulator [Bacillota bacterium]
MNRKTLIDRIDRLIHLIAGKFSREVAQAIEGTMSVSEFLVLRMLAQTGPSRVSQIARKMQITASAVTFLTDKLADKELILRKRDEADRRVVLVSITEKGARVLEELEALRRAAAERMLEGLSDSELSGIVAILEKLAGSIAPA